MASAFSLRRTLRPLPSREHASKNLYWRYDDVKRQMDAGYPHDVSRWRGVPAGIDAAMQWTDGKRLVRAPGHSGVPAPANGWAFSQAGPTFSSTSCFGDSTTLSSASTAASHSRPPPTGSAVPNRSDRPSRPQFRSLCSLFNSLLASPCVANALSRLHKRNATLHRRSRAHCRPQRSVE